MLIEVKLKKKKKEKKRRNSARSANAIGAEEAIRLCMRDCTSIFKHVCGFCILVIPFFSFFFFFSFHADGREERKLRGRTHVRTKNSVYSRVCTGIEPSGFLVSLTWRGNDTRVQLLIISTEVGNNGL